MSIGVQILTLHRLRRRRIEVDGPLKEFDLTNQQCLEKAREFYTYADVEGYRGSPHKL